LFSYKSIWQDLKDRREIAPFFRSAALSAFEKTAVERNVEPVDVGPHSEEGLRKRTLRKSIFGGKLGSLSRTVGFFGRFDPRNPQGNVVRGPRRAFASLRILPAPSVLTLARQRPAHRPHAARGASVATRN
jgi:hypothetical protein